MNEIVVNKVTSIRRCVARAKSVYAKPSDTPFSEDIDRQDIVVLNLMRACEQAIDLVNHVVRELGLGLPQSSRDGFELLAGNEVITADLADKLSSMVGFRNVAVHQYQRLNVAVIENIVTEHLDDFEVLATAVLGQRRLL